MIIKASLYQTRWRRGWRYPVKIKCTLRAGAWPGWPPASGSPGRAAGLTVMDYGCGIGSATPSLFALLGVTWVLGTDISPQSLAVAQRTYGSAQARFLLFDHYRPDASLDLVYCNGVFHHIPPQDRAAAVAYVARTLRPGGLWAFWKTTPGIRGRGMSCGASPSIVRRDHSLHRRHDGCCGRAVSKNSPDRFQFIFPRLLQWLRGLNPGSCAGRLVRNIRYYAASAKCASRVE